MRRTTLSAAAAAFLLLLTGCTGAIDTGSADSAATSDDSIPVPPLATKTNPT